jgi:hypothetical protein
MARSSKQTPKSTDTGGAKSSTVREAVATYGAPTKPESAEIIGIQPEVVIRHTELLLEAFALVPEEHRTNLPAYFEESPGKYSLTRFLNLLSDWAAANQGLDVRHSRIKRQSGVWKNDPHWDELMDYIAKHNK